MTVPRVFTLRQAVEAMGGTTHNGGGAPSVDVLRRAIERGELRAIRFGRILRVTETELRRWLEGES